MTEPIECHRLDTPSEVYFYENDFYVLSNFSAFQVKLYGLTFPTAEHAYHYLRFEGVAPGLCKLIQEAPSAHEAFILAQQNKDRQIPDWDNVKLDAMRSVIWAKQEQHKYVRRKLLDTGSRQLIEDSWRDAFWGWGPNRDGKNTLGKLWMEVRAILRDKGYV